jgi:hypothetical protein
LCQDLVGRSCRQQAVVQQWHQAVGTTRPADAQDAMLGASEWQLIPKRHRVAGADINCSLLWWHTDR